MSVVAHVLKSVKSITNSTVQQPLHYLMVEPCDQQKALQSDKSELELYTSMYHAISLQAKIKWQKKIWNFHRIGVGKTTIFYYCLLFFPFHCQKKL